jgi:bacterioferritin-associated ferredoxin
MDRAAEFMAAVRAVEAGAATLDQAEEVLAMASLCGRADLAARASAILDEAEAKGAVRGKLRRAQPVGA